MKRIFAAYQYVGPVVLTPLAAWLWWRHYDGNAALAAIAVLVPMAHAYVVPGIGTNILRVWEFDVRLKLGRFRPHHGFVFGSATALLLLPVIGAPDPQPSWLDVTRAGVAAACLLGLVNWLYDWAAIRVGILKVYNQPWADRRGARSIASDYAFWFFGGFGLIHAAGLRLAERVLLADPDPRIAALIGVGLLAATATLPTIGYVLQSYVRHGHHGCYPVAQRTGEPR